MQNEQAQIMIDGTPIQIKNLVDLHAHWPQIRGRIQSAIENDELEDPNIAKIIEWLIVLGDKTLFRIE